VSQCKINTVTINEQLICWGREKRSTESTLLLLGQFFFQLGVEGLNLSMLSSLGQLFFFYSWVSGVPMVQHPFVWAACLRYLHNQQLQDRVCVPPEGFLLVTYTTTHSKPEFYEVVTTSGKPDLQFDLYTGYEVTSLLKVEKQMFCVSI
jgi:hypothetical protein